MKQLIFSLIILTTTSIFSLQLFGSVSTSELEQSVIEFVENKLHEESSSPQDFEVAITSTHSYQNIPACSQALNINIENHSYNLKHLSVRVQCNDPRKWHIRVPVKIKNYKDIIVARHYISRNQILTKHDIAISRQDVNEIRGDYFTDHQDVLGTVAQRNIQPDSVVQGNMIKAALVIKRGENVRVIAQNTGLSIEMNGTALSNAAKGDIIKIRNTRSNKVLEAVALESGIATMKI